MWFGVFLLILSTCNAARILVYSPTISPSHMKINSAVADALVVAGHNVVRICVVLMQFKCVFKTIIEVHYMVDPQKVNFVKLAERKSVPNARKLCQINYTQTHVESNEILNYLRSNHFDFAINEHVDLCGTAMAHAAGISIHVLLSTSPLFEHTALTIGLTEEINSVPAFRHHNYKPSENTLWNRMENIVDWAISYWGLRYGSQLVNEVFRSRFGDNFPDVDYLAANSALFLVNTDEFVDYPRQTRHNIVYIGGLGLSTIKTDKNSLRRNSPQLFEVINNDFKDVIYFSLGSITSTKHLPPTFMENLIQTFQKFQEFQFIVKVDDANQQILDANSTNNIHFLTWAPQRDILSNPKTKLFITHAGYGSILETAHAGVPVVCLPFFMDQYRNAQLAEQNGWGRVFEKQDLLYSSHSFEQAMRDVLTNQKYQKNSQRLSKILKNKPQNAEQRLNQAIRLLELANFDLKELRPASANLDFVTRHNFDLVMMFSFLSFFAVQFSLYCMYKLVCFVWQTQIVKFKTVYEKIE
ncbi:Glucuronosyltransferase [Aphelenchoides bicaudatus]|nr:Glucuronosyltransferase [Aphelenchoides bicaudatus]